MGERVLFFVEGWGNGGIESVIMDIVRAEEFQSAKRTFDIFCICDWNDGFDQEIESLGGKRFVCYPGTRPGLAKKLLSGIRGFSKIIKSAKYDVVHINATNGSGLVYAWLAERCGIPIRVAHAHNSSFDSPTGAKIKSLVHWLGKALFGNAPTERIACSPAAGDFMFDDKPYQVLLNGVEVDRFAFSDQDRRSVRSELGFPEDAIVIGSVGRIDTRKNPLFMVDVFAEYKKKKRDSYCLFVGSGDLEAELNKKTLAYGVSDSVRLVPATSRPERYYSAIDILLVPSLSEGFGLVAVEGQCSGLPVLSSTALPEDVCCTPRAKRIPLSWGKNRWAEEVGRMLHSNDFNRVLAVDEVKGTPLDAKEMARQINVLYESSN